MAPVRIYIYAGTAVVRTGLTGLLAGAPGIHVVGSGDAAGPMDLERLALDLVLIHGDSSLGVEIPALIQATRRSCPGARILLLTPDDDPRHLISCIAAGVDGYLGQGLERSALHHAIHQVLRYGLILDRDRVPALRQRLALAAGRSPLAGLTQRERVVVGHLARGRSNREIAAATHVSINTVKSHLRSVYEKTGVSSRVELAALAVRAGLDGREDETAAP